MLNYRTRTLASFISLSLIWFLCPLKTGPFSGPANLKAVSESADPRQGVSFAHIPAGSFQMGSSTGYGDERPCHTVNLNAFRISAAEITNQQYAAFLNEAMLAGKVMATHTSVTGVSGPFSGEVYLDLLGDFDADNACGITYDGTEFSVLDGWEESPVVYVTWFGAYMFASYYGFRLPTEAEWEYAARCGEQAEYGTDDGTIYNDNANFGRNIGYPTMAGEYLNNRFGLFDMAGNVWEWCQDWYDYGYYENSPENSPAGPESGTLRILRGGSWYSSMHECRSSFRYKQQPDFRRSDTGFRVVW
jgi:formylglycine-generating enzyme